MELEIIRLNVINQILKGKLYVFSCFLSCEILDFKSYINMGAYRS